MPVFLEIFSEGAYAAAGLKTEDGGFQVTKTKRELDADLLHLWSRLVNIGATPIKYREGVSDKHACIDEVNVLRSALNEAQTDTDIDAIADAYTRLTHRVDTSCSSEEKVSDVS